MITTKLFASFTDFNISYAIGEKEEISADIICTVRCLTLAVNKKIRKEKLSKNNKKPTTGLRSKDDVSERS